MEYFKRDGKGGLEPCDNPQGYDDSNGTPHKGNIEQIEQGIRYLTVQVGDSDYCQCQEATGELQKEALKLLLAVAKGEAHVMRWVDAPDEPIEVKAGEQSILTLGGFDKKSLRCSHMTFKPIHTHYATFNGSPVIPTPKEK